MINFPISQAQEIFQMCRKIFCDFCFLHQMNPFVKGVISANYDSSSSSHSLHDPIQTGKLPKARLPLSCHQKHWCVIFYLQVILNSFVRMPLIYVERSACFARHTDSQVTRKCPLEKTAPVNNSDKPMGVWRRYIPNRGEEIEEEQNCVKQGTVQRHVSN